MSDQEWMDELKKVAVEKYGYAPEVAAAFEPEVWLECRQSEMTPDEALYADGGE